MVKPQPFEGASLAALQSTFLLAQIKHPGHTLNVPHLEWPWKLAALAEEFGEVSQLLTYDKINEGDPDSPEHDRWKAHLINELLQLSALALAWVESLDHGGV